jgi:hypothetical protein
MKRDFDLIRRIMTDIEEKPAGLQIRSLTYPEYDQATIYQHINLLINENFINGITHKTAARIDAIIINGLTWKGHDFIDAAKDDTLWKKAKETILKPTVSMTFTILLEWLKEEAKKKLGLP